MAYDESTGTTSVVTIKTRSNIKDSITRCGGSITKCFTKIYIQDGHMVSLNSQPLKTADKGSAILIIGHDSCEQRIKMKFTRFNFLVYGIRC